MLNHEKIDSNNVEDVMELTEMQKSMLFHYVMDVKSSDYFEQTSYDLIGKLDIHALVECWNEVAKENEMLRTVFRWMGIKTPVQVTLKEMDIPVLVEYFNDIPVDARHEKLLAVMERERREGINLAKHPFRINLLQWDDEHIIMIVNCHHIISDGWSNAILLSDFFRQYLKIIGENDTQAISKGKYKDYVKWMAERKKEEEKIFWRSCLQGYTPTENKSRQRNVIQSKTRYSIPLAEEVRKRLYHFVEKKGITLSCLLYSVLALLIHLVEQTDDLVFGTTVSGRPAEVENVETVFGLFINTALMRIQFHKNDTVIKLIEDVNRFMLNRKDFEYTSLTELSEYCGNLDFQQLLKYVIVVQNYPVSHELLAGTEKIKLELNERFYKSEVEMLLGIRVFDNIIFDFDYNPYSFSEGEVKTLADDYISLLNQLTSSDFLEGDSKALKEIKITSTYFTKNEENVILNDIAELESVNFD